MVSTIILKQKGKTFFRIDLFFIFWRDIKWTVRDSEGRRGHEEEWSVTMSHDDVKAVTERSRDRKRVVCFAHHLFVFYLYMIYKIIWKGKLKSVTFYCLFGLLMCYFLLLLGAHIRLVLKKKVNVMTWLDFSMTWLDFF